MNILEAAALFKPKITAIIKSGSSVLPWIENPHDTDYIIFINGTKGEWIAQFYALKPDNECWFIVDTSNKIIRIYQYLYHYGQIIFGTLPEALPDIFENEREYKAKLINYINEPYSKYKFWYHILTGIYLIQNGCYELSEDQIQNIRLCHDKQITEEIYNFIQEQLLRYKKELE